MDTHAPHTRLHTQMHTHRVSDNPSDWVQPSEQISLPSFIGILYEALRLHMQAVKLISPPPNPSILMLVHTGLGHIKPMINDVLIGLFSTTELRC